MKNFFNKIKDKKNNILKMLISGGSLLITVLVFMPCDVFLNNAFDFSFPISDFFVPLLLKFVLSLLILFILGAVLHEKITNVLFCLFCGLSLCIYAQYLFMNRHLGVFIGEETDWSEFTSFGIITLIIWIALLAVPFVVFFAIKAAKEKRNVILWLLSGFLGATQLLSLITLAILSKANFNDYRNTYADGTEQYIVSSNKNIVTFIFDATDNIYFEKLLSDSPEVFEGLEDFTLYDNTCCIYDYTSASISQMYAGETSSFPMSDVNTWTREVWTKPKVADYYQRFHDAGYKLNAYMDTSIEIKLLEDKFDNADSGSYPINVDKQGIEKGMLELSLYRCLPFMFKKYLNASHIDFAGLVEFPSDYNKTNDSYFDLLKLSKSDSEKNYFIIEHLNGTHAPCDDVIAETVKCLDIVKEYIGQMKQLGVYDDAAIIITSDHGRHTEEYSEGAATPIFMIKEPNSSHEKMQFNSAPISHADFMSTYLKIAGIYTDEDKEIYGTSIYDYDENSVRERLWYDHRNDNNYPSLKGEYFNVYYVYKYTGNANDLKNVIENGEPVQVIVKN